MHMSEINKPAGYMAQLDAWTQETVITPLYEAWETVETAPDEPFIGQAQEDLLNVVAAVKKAVREKVLESYRNGQAVGPRPSSQPVRQGQRQAEAPSRSFRRA